MTFLISLTAIVLVCSVVLLRQYLLHQLCDCPMCEQDREIRKAWR